MCSCKTLRPPCCPQAVLCNEGDPRNAACLHSNLSSAAAAAATPAGAWSDSALAAGGREWTLQAAGGRRRRCELVHEEAAR